MKNLIKTSLATALSCMLFSAAASAQVISNTGPGSNNTITQTNTSVRTCTNSNVVGVTNVNNQTSTSGSATTSGNTTGGSATSGSASNSNSSSTSVAVNNSCGATTANTPGRGGSGGGQVTPQNGGGGAGAGEAVSAELASVASLPATGATSPAQYLAGSLAAASALAIAGYLGRQYATRVG